VDTFSKVFTIGVSGYNDKLPLFLQTILDKVRDIEIDPRRLAIVKEEVRCIGNLKLRTIIDDDIFS